MFTELGDSTGPRLRRVAARPRASAAGDSASRGPRRARARARACGGLRRPGAAPLGDPDVLQPLLRRPTPVGEATGRLEELLDSARDDRVLEAVVKRFLAELYAMAGRFEEALELVRESSRVLDELDHIQTLGVPEARRGGEGARRRPRRRRAGLDGDGRLFPQPGTSSRGLRPLGARFTNWPPSTATRAAGTRPPSSSRQDATPGRQVPAGRRAARGRGAAGGAPRRARRGGGARRARSRGLRDPRRGPELSGEVLARARRGAASGGKRPGGRRRRREGARALRAEGQRRRRRTRAGTHRSSMKSALLELRVREVVAADRGQLHPGEELALKAAKIESWRRGR